MDSPSATLLRAAYFDIESEGERKATYSETHLCLTCRSSELCRFRPETNDALIAVTRCRLYEIPG